MAILRSISTLNIFRLSRFEAAAARAATAERKEGTLPLDGATPVKEPDSRARNLDELLAHDLEQKQLLLQPVTGPAVRTHIAFGH